MASRRALVVDDKRDATDSARAVLELSGHNVQIANDGANGLRIAHTFRQDVVLLDIGLPYIDRYAVARALRAQRWGDRTVLVAVMGHESDRIRSQEAGFDHHLVKPIDFDVVADILGGDREPGRGARSGAPIVCDGSVRPATPGSSG